MNASPCWSSGSIWGGSTNVCNDASKMSFFLSSFIDTHLLEPGLSLQIELHCASHGADERQLIIRLFGPPVEQYYQTSRQSFINLWDVTRRREFPFISS
jgi:hypothetical protein